MARPAADPAGQRGRAAGLAGGGSFLGIVSLVLLATNLLLIPAALRLRGRQERSTVDG